MTVFDKLARERRARLVAERLLEQSQRDHAEMQARCQMLTREIESMREQLAARPAAAPDAAPASANSEKDEAEAVVQAAQRNAVMAERRLWDSINSIRDGFAVFDREQKLIVANQAFLLVFSGLDEVRPGIGYARLMELLAWEGRVELGAARPAEWVALMQERLTQKPIPAATLQFTGGATVSLIERRARGGDLVVLARDITETARHEAELDEARRRAEAANRAKSAFLANMSHEIRTPMNGIVGMAELICDTEMSEEQKLYAETIRSSGEALLAIINDVLDFSKIEADKLVLRPERFDLERCIHEVMILLQAGARKRSIDLLMDYDLFLPTRFMADPGRMRQVLINLIGNAVKFTEVGHVLIRVVGVEAGEGQFQINVTIEDTGIGIAADYQARIFDEFSQAEDQANRKFEGTGLGLAITRRLIEQMGGRIWVESEPGQGACFGFSLTLPLAEAGMQPPLEQVPIPVQHVLVVDDHLINRTILERQLGAQGMKVTLCESAAQALRVLGERGGGNPVDLVITDQEMPGMGGLDFAMRIRALGLAQPIILLSSNPGVAQDHPGGRELFAALQKPVLRQELISRLQRLGSPSESDEADFDEERARAASADSGAARRMRILLAEDNRTNRLVFSKMVGEFDIDLVVAESGREAVELFGRHQPDLVFMDISMPEMDGREATKAIRQLPGGAQIAIVALTAHALESDRADTLAAGLDHYLTKPLSKSLLSEMIMRYCPDEACPPVRAMQQAG
ncbi:MAG: response regulator [Pararhodobacter sp.]|nr:response regulator [Pararhodobacter sp.]